MPCGLKYGLLFHILSPGPAPSESLPDRDKDLKSLFLLHHYPPGPEEFPASKAWPAIAEDPGLAPSGNCMAGSPGEIL